MKKYCIRIFISIILLFGLIKLNAQDLKEQALNEFKLQHYPKAIELLNKALIQNPVDAEIYYYLGFFNHYLAHDSNPIDIYESEEHSQKVLKYLNKAISLNPKYGDAYYFLGAEYGSRSLDAMQKGDS